MVGGGWGGCWGGVAGFGVIAGGYGDILRRRKPIKNAPTLA